MIFETERLIIRNYRDEDRPIFAAIGGNPQARIYHQSVVTPAESDGFIDRQIETINKIGCGFAVVERKADGIVVGDVGIRPVPNNSPHVADLYSAVDTLPCLNTALPSLQSDCNSITA